METHIYAGYGKALRIATRWWPEGPTTTIAVLAGTPDFDAYLNAEAEFMADTISRWDARWAAWSRAQDAWVNSSAPIVRFVIEGVTGDQVVDALKEATPHDEYVIERYVPGPTAPLANRMGGVPIFLNAGDVRYYYSPVSGAVYFTDGLSVAVARGGRIFVEG